MIFLHGEASKKGHMYSLKTDQSTVHEKTLFITLHEEKSRLCVFDDS